MSAAHFDKRVFIVSYYWHTAGRRQHTGAIVCHSYSAGERCRQYTGVIVSFVCTLSYLLVYYWYTARCRQYRGVIVYHIIFETQLKT